MNSSIERRNLITTANAVELASAAIMKVMGHDCAKTRDGHKLTRQLITDGVASKINSHMSDALRG